jgi:hypothetical protein
MSPEEKLRKEDREWLMQQPQFRRHLFEILSASGIYRVTREEQQRLFLEGKRSLGLEILGWFDADVAEPLDAISAAIGARMIFSKGAMNDRSSDQSESE